MPISLVPVTADDWRACAARKVPLPVHLCRTLGFPETGETEGTEPVPRRRP